MRNNSLKLLAEELAAHGFASLRIDKRGVGESKAAALREADMRIDDYVEDAIAWAHLLQSRYEAQRLVFLGHSEGAFILTRAARLMAPDGLILLAGAGQRLDALIQRQLEADSVSPELLNASARILEHLKNGEAISPIPQELSGLYRESVQNYIMSALRFGPAEELAKLSCRTLIVQGTTDIQVSVEDAQILSRARPDAQIALIENMNHVLKRAPANRAENILIYNAPDAPLAPGLTRAIADFLRACVS